VSAPDLGSPNSQLQAGLGLERVFEPADAEPAVTSPERQHHPLAKRCRDELIKLERYPAEQFAEPDEDQSRINHVWATVAEGNEK
jgi:hypothetical protein